MNKHTDCLPAGSQAVPVPTEMLPSRLSTHVSDIASLSGDCGTLEMILADIHVALCGHGLGSQPQINAIAKDQGPAQVPGQLDELGRFAELLSTRIQSCRKTADAILAMVRK